MPSSDDPLPRRAGGRALVLGAGGFIGGHLCQALRRSGREVVAYDRYGPPEWARGDGGLTWIVGDFAHDSRVPDLARDCAVVHLLIGGRSPAAVDADPAGDLIDNAVPVLRFLEALRSGGAPRIVFASSGGAVYGAGEHRPIGEDAPTAPTGAYGVNKLLVEAHLLLRRRRDDFDVRILRVANPFGERQLSRLGQGVVAAFVEAAARGRPLTIMGDGSVVRDYVYVGDVARAFVLAGDVEDPGRRIFNIGGGHGRSVAEVADAVEAIAGRPLVREWVPARPVDVPVAVLDVSRARTELGWAPETPWETALERAYRWTLERVDDEG